MKIKYLNKMKIKYLNNLKTSSIILIVAVLFIACNKTVKHDMIITHVNIIDVKTGEIMENQTVAIDSVSITAIYDKEIRHSESTKVIDGSNKYLIPGLWDMHTHYYSNHELTDPLLIANGITGVREMWGNMQVINEVREKTKTGEIIAPDIYTSGVIIDGKPPYWPGSVGVSTPEEAKKIAIKQIEEGVDFLKIYSLLTEECFMAIADVAKQMNIPFAGHIPQSVSTYDAINAGMASSEHLIGILEACNLKEDSIRALPWNFMKYSQFFVDEFIESKFDSLIIVLAQSDMWLCPTLTVIRAYGYLNDTAFTNDERLSYLPDYYTAYWNLDSPYFKENFEKYYMGVRKMYHLEMELIGKMHEKGVKILAGTDYPNPYCFPGFSLHDELALLVEGGMPELDALKAATINAAVFMGKENEFGSIEVGKLASLVLLKENPLDNIENTKSIEAVILRGKVFDRAALDEMLEQAKINAVKIPYSFWLRNKISSIGIEKALDSLDILITGNSIKYKLLEYDINILGYEYLNTGDTEIAIQIFKNNIDLFSESSNVYDSYAESLMKNGQYKLAIENYKIVLEIDPSNSNARLMLDSIRNLKKNLQKH